MKSLPSAALTHYQQPLSTITICWRVVRRDATVIRGTQEARDVVITTGDLAGTYRAATGITASALRTSSDLAVDNGEITGGFQPGDLSLFGLNSADIEAGLYDDASFTVFECNWADPDAWQNIIGSGWIGGISYTPEGQYRAEARGLKQSLKQPVTKTYSVKCLAELGDSECTVSLAPLTVSGTVTSVTSRRRFNASLTGGSSPAAGHFVEGLVTWLTGDNAGYQMEVKRDAAVDTLGQIDLYQPMPEDIEIGDTFTMVPGCPKTVAACRDRFNNIVNFRGYGVLVPGRNKIIQYGET